MPSRHKSQKPPRPPSPSGVAQQQRREAEKEARREAIIDAAEAVIAKVGWDTTNFGEIAKLTGLSRSLIYVYFPTKADLFHAISRRGATVLRDLFSNALAGADSGLDRIELIGRAYYQFAREHPVYFKFHSEQDHEPAGDGSGKGAPAFSHPAFEMLGQALALGIADGSIQLPGVDLRRTALVVWTFTHGLLSISTRKAEFLRVMMGVPPSELVDDGFRLLRGMLAK
ncbi:TetR/AcrR family transcriptional regulator [Luteolibacter flavescens]|uniref:TetR/AcrR family transcriptional regulator n=1 Tax=Luteolibacter flavescens TaxID=1859460 RepID=A0ABT3FPQ6_9BACT|nr:TetR/AcrR family transcriptional regulator [Luteolibacter flavescens]MCW1885556.1 TetR/AcrR family transcriptional regulator [Luteolibacter flavescens]